MIEIEEISPAQSSAQRQQFGWLISVFTRPARTMQAVAMEEKARWPLPLLLLTAFTLISIVVAGPLRLAVAQNSSAEPPPNFEYMTPEQQQQYMQAQASMNGPTTTVVFPAVGATIGLWLSWFILGSILHLVLTLLGSRGTITSAYNLSAWSSLPLAIRLCVQIAAMLITQRLITSPGFSGFINVEATSILLYTRTVLRYVDIYLIWQFILLWLGASANSGLGRGKAFGGVFFVMLLTLALSALPSYLAAQLGELNVTRPFIFF